jgi:carbonic anhydrase/acetyltransferase-like protein (isoleucine patch superfamily)
MSKSFIDHNLEIVGQIDPAPEQVELNQSDYNAIVSHFRAHGKNIITIPLRYDTSHLNLAMDIPHHFKGDNTIKEVPEGSFVGDFSKIEADATIDNCSIGNSVEIGDNSRVNNSYVGLACEVGNDVVFSGCEVELLLEAKSIKVDNCLLMGMGSINKLFIGDNNIIYPGYEAEKVISVGVDNTFVGEQIPKLPPLAKDKNTFLPVEDFTYAHVSEHPQLVENNEQVPYFTSIRSDIEDVIKRQTALYEAENKAAKETDEQSLDHSAPVSGPGAS